MEALLTQICRRLGEVRRRQGVGTAEADDPGARFADLLDSMGLVEFLACLAEDCGVTPEGIERCVGHRFGTVAELAAALHAAGIVPVGTASVSRSAPEPGPAVGQAASCWLAATAVRLPDTLQPAAALNALLGRPKGWLERHAGIEGRRLWDGQDPLEAADEAARDCLRRTGLAPDRVGTLLVTSEAPPLLVGLAAALHQRLELRPGAAALEIGGACTGFLAALWLARSLLAQSEAVLVVAVEAPSRYLEPRPGPSGEAAALFGDAAAACLVCHEPAGPEAVPLGKIVQGTDGGAGRLLQVCRLPSGEIEVSMEGRELAGRAIRAMTQAVRDRARDEGWAVEQLAAVIAHGGNGRMPALLARQLGLPAERVWSQTARQGNLGSASLPVAWAARTPCPAGPAAWVAVGAGLTWATALTGPGMGWRVG